MTSFSIQIDLQVATLGNWLNDRRINVPFPELRRHFSRL